MIYSSMPSPEIVALVAQLHRAQQLRDQFHAQVVRFDEWLKEYGHRMQTYYEKQSIYHERMLQVQDWQRQLDCKKQEARCTLGITHQSGDDHEDSVLSISITTHAVVAETATLPEKEACSTDISDTQWERVAPLLTMGTGRGRPYVDTRRTLNGILYVLATDCSWKHMPRRYGSYVTCWRRYIRWQAKNLWTQVQACLSTASVDEQREADLMPVLAQAHQPWSVPEYGSF